MPESNLKAVSPSLLVAHARTALKIALRQLGMKKGDKVLVPDSICDVVIQTIRQADLLPIYFPLAPNFAPEWVALESIANSSKCRAILMVHYFGQPQDIERFQSFCARHNLLLLEDNAHGHGGYFSGKLLGSYGDAGISSPRKILHTPSGSVLYGIASPSPNLLQTMRPFPAYRPIPVLKYALGLIPFARRRIKGWLDRNNDWDDPYLFRDSSHDEYLIDRFSQWRITSTDWEWVAARRRKNWTSWAQYARNSGLSLVFSNVHPESCPWAMPAYASDLSERNAWLTWGAAQGISLFPWPTLPEEIVLLSGAALARWKILVCFPLDSSPDELLN